VRAFLGPDGQNAIALSNKEPVPISQPHPLPRARSGPFYSSWSLGLRLQGGSKMSTVQAFALGAMVSWTPSLIFLACLLWQAGPIGDEDKSSAFDA
jgi:hypothetical protein